MLVLGKIEVLEPIELIDPLLVLQNWKYLAVQCKVRYDDKTPSTITNLGLISGMWSTVGSLLISVLVDGWLMLEAVDKLLLSGKDLLTDCALATDWDLANINIIHLPSIFKIFPQDWLNFQNITFLQPEQKLKYIFRTMLAVSWELEREWILKQVLLLEEKSLVLSFTFYS